MPPSRMSRLCCLSSELSGEIIAKPVLTAFFESYRCRRTRVRVLLHVRLCVLVNLLS